MSKRITFLLILIAAILVWNYRDKIMHGQFGLGNFKNQATFDNTIVEALKKEILTSGPLRSKTNYPNSVLTQAGIIAETNVQRGMFGVSILKENQKLNEAAALKVKDMFRRQYFEHLSPDGKGPSDLAGNVHYDYIAIGENLALGNFKDDAALLEAWMNSPGHKANIINSKFTEIGVAVGQGEYEGKTVWLAVQEFGKPVSDCPVVDVGLKAKLDGIKLDTGELELQINLLKKEIEAINPKDSQRQDEYNAKVSEYNNLIQNYNNKVDSLKLLAGQYNQQVNAFNRCLGK